MKNMIVLFDFDGVVLDSLPAVRTAVTKVREANGLNAPDDYEVRRWLGPPLAQSTERFAKELGLDAARQSEMNDMYVEAVCEASRFLQAFDGIEQLLKELDTVGARTGLATMKSWEEIDAVGHKYLPCLAFFKDRVFAPKSHADNIDKTHIVEKALEHLCDSQYTKNNAYMIGDRASDIEAANANGISGVGVTWGAGSEKELINAGAMHLVHSVDELRDYLSRCS